MSNVSSIGFISEFERPGGAHILALHIKLDLTIFEIPKFDNLGNDILLFVGRIGVETKL